MWDSVTVPCFVVRYFVSILALQSSWWERQSWLLCLVCLPGVFWLLCGSSSQCQGAVCSLWVWYFLIILTYYFFLFQNILLLNKASINHKVAWPLDIKHTLNYQHLLSNDMQLIKSIKCYLTFKEFGWNSSFINCVIIICIAFWQTSMLMYEYDGWKFCFQL